MFQPRSDLDRKLVDVFGDRVTDKTARLSSNFGNLPRHVVEFFIARAIRGTDPEKELADYEDRLKGHLPGPIDRNEYFRHRLARGHLQDY